MDWTKDFLAKNVAGGKLIVGVITIDNEDTRLIEVARYNPEVISGLKTFYDRKILQATNDISSFLAKANESAFSVKHVETESHSHTVFNGSKAIEVAEIDTSAKAITVHENISNSGRAIEVHSPQMDRIEAIELLDSHWKKVESEVKKIKDKRKLNLLLVIAIEKSVADKKKQIIEDRLNELS